MLLEIRIFSEIDYSDVLHYFLIGYCKLVGNIFDYVSLSQTVNHTMSLLE